MDDILLDRPYLFLGSRLKRVAEQLQSDVIRLSQAAGLPMQPGQYPLLATLDRYGPKTIGQLAVAMKLTQPTVTRTVDRLEKLQLVSVERLHRDRRHKTVSLTTSGIAAVTHSKDHVWPAVEKAVEAFVGSLSGSLLQQVAALEARLNQGSLTPAAASILSLAKDEDISAVVSLLNVAFRGAGPQAGWNSEADYMDGARADEASFRLEIAEKPGSELLVFRTDDRVVRGCVLLEPKSGGAWGIGSLAVEPQGQNAGLGRSVLAAAETWARDHGATEIQMTVVNVRQTLIAWYERRGYRLTGEQRPFPYDDHRFGVPRRSDLAFLVMHKLFD